MLNVILGLTVYESHTTHTVSQVTVLPSNNDYGRSQKFTAIFVAIRLNSAQNISGSVYQKYASVRAFSGSFSAVPVSVYRSERFSPFAGNMKCTCIHCKPKKTHRNVFVISSRKPRQF